LAVLIKQNETISFFGKQSTFAHRPVFIFVERLPGQKDSPVQSSVEQLEAALVAVFGRFVVVQSFVQFETIEAIRRFNIFSLRRLSDHQEARREFFEVEMDGNHEHLVVSVRAQHNYVSSMKNKSRKFDKTIQMHIASEISLVNLIFVVEK
jgi:2-succinyl-5-enolpyruvyl-6-hydroxy-3-cyclohexene-1-carboxylate synthase